MAHPLHVSVASWLVFRFLLGFCVTGLMLITESWINGHATKQTRGALLATYMVLFFLAASSGQFLIALGDPGDFQLFVVAAIFSPSGLIYFLAGSLGVLVVLCLHSFVREKAPNVAAQSHCVGIAPVSTAVLMDLDPREAP